MIQKDTYLHKGLRKQLVDLLKSKGIENIAILEAIGKIPRHLFIVDSALMKHAYEDKAFPIGSGQTISQPYTVAYQTELLQLKKGDKILEVGTGSGYQASVLCELGCKVFSIERQRELFLRTKKFLPQLGYKLEMFYGDGYKGLPQYAPFDKIIITAGVPSVPQDLLSQLKIGGILVIPIGEQNENQIMTTITRKDNTNFVRETHGTFRFVPMLRNKV